MNLIKNDYNTQSKFRAKEAFLLFAGDCGCVYIFINLNYYELIL